MKKEYIIPISKVNKVALLSIIPITIIYAAPFVLINGFTNFHFSNIRMRGILSSFIWFTIIFIVGVILHELLHGISWALFAKKKWKSISFGIKWEYLTPYCHCDEPLRKNHFIIGAIMPLFVMGIIPAVVSLCNGNIRIWFFGLFFTIAAMGDIMAVWVLRKAPKKSWIEDHPSELGFYVDEKEKEKENN